MSSPPDRAVSRAALAALSSARSGITPPPGGLSNKVEIIQPDQYTDRRSEPRVACDDRGALLLLANHEIVSCRVLDQSPSGARVAFDSISHLPAEIWLIDLDTKMAKRGSAAWSMPNRMGLKFNFLHTFVDGAPRSPKVPQEVHDAYIRLSNPAAAAKPDDKPDNDDDVLFLD